MSQLRDRAYQILERLPVSDKVLVETWVREESAKSEKWGRSQTSLFGYIIVAVAIVLVSGAVYDTHMDGLERKLAAPLEARIATCEQRLDAVENACQMAYGTMYKDP